LGDERVAGVAEVGERPVGRQRSSRQAVAIEEVLRDADGFRTALEIYDEIRRRGEAGSLTTVYRHVNLLAETGRADVVYRGDAEARYRLCGTGAAAGPGGADRAADSAAHHHHVVCRECGRSVEVSGAEVEGWAERVAAAAGYTEVSHTLEVFGLCPEHSVRDGHRARET
jgi:Fur family ferric uptake transcriptional regulator